MDENLAIGIDLGTTYSCVAVMRAGRVQVIPNEYGNNTTPSYVAFTDEGRLIGELALDHSAQNPTQTLFDAKRLIGRNFDDLCVQEDIKHWPFTVVEVAGKPKIQVTYQAEEKLFAPEEISGMVLTKLKHTAENFLKQPVSRAVVTVPAYFNDAQRRSTKDAATLAGLDVLRVINEPTAAALAYGLADVRPEERYVLIFDLGGGTFDVSVLLIDDGIFEVKATAGNTHLGGEDFDQCLMDFCLGEFFRKHKRDGPITPRALRKLRTACERAKRALSVSEVTHIEVDAFCENNDFLLEITRSKFESLCDEYFKKTLSLVEKVLEDSGISKDRVDDVVLVGGSTRIPRVQSLLRDFFNGKEPCKTINPDEAVAHGAAVQAAILSGHRHEAVENVLLMDVCPLSLGIEANDGEFVPVISRNTGLPCRGRDTFSTYYDNQPGVAIKVYEGERARVVDNHFLGRFDLMGIEAAKRGEPDIEVTFNLDCNGLLEVEAFEKVSGAKRVIAITTDTGRLSGEEICRMLEEAERFAEDDRQFTDRTQAKMTLEKEVYRAKRGAAETVQRQHIDVHCDGILQWLESNPSAEPEECEEKLRGLEELVSSLCVSE